MKRIAFWGVLAVAGVLAFGWFGVNAFNAGHEAQEPSTAIGRTAPGRGKLAIGRPWPTMSAEDAVRAALPTNLVSQARKRTMRKPAELFSNLHGEDRANAEAVQAALDADDLAATLKAVRASLASTNAEVRLNAVEALGWFGAPALPELTACMADADEDVQEAAENQWELAVQELEKPDERFGVVMAALGTLSNADQLSSMGGILSNAATEWIDDADEEDVSADRRFQVVQALAELIEGHEVAVNVEAAKEVYSDVTGNEWRGVEEAQRYLDDPENYELPEDRETTCSSP